MRKTGIFEVEVKFEDVTEDIYSLNSVKRLIRKDMGDYLIRLHDDGRIYCVSYKWVTGNKDSLKLEARVTLANPNEAQVKEYVSLGSVDTFLKDGSFDSFIYLGPELLFRHDDFGWYRAYISDEEKVKIRGEVKKAQSDVTLINDVDSPRDADMYDD